MKVNLGYKYKQSIFKTADSPLYTYKKTALKCLVIIGWNRKSSSLGTYSIIQHILALTLMIEVGLQTI